MKLEKIMNNGWTCFMEDELIIEQYPETGEDNTTELGRVIIPNMDKVIVFAIYCNGNVIGINLKQRHFLIGDTVIPFYSASQNLKLVYFMTRTVTAGDDGFTQGDKDPELTELSKIYTVGYEDEEGKLFLNMREDCGMCILSNQNPSL